MSNVMGAVRAARALSYENRLLLILTLGGAVAALDAQSLFYLSPFVATSLGLNNTQIGLVSSTVLLSWSISGYVIGRLSDRSGRRKPWLVATFVMFAACSFLSGLAGSFAVLLGARLVMGLAEGPVIPVSQSIMIRHSSPHRRGFNMGLVQNFGAQLVGSLAGPIVLVQIATTLGWHAAFYIAGVPGLVVALLIAAFVNERAGGSPGPEQSPKAAAAVLGLSGLVRVRNIRLCILISCCVVAWYFVLLAFLPLYCVRVLRLTPAGMSVVMSAIGAAGVVSALLVPALSDGLGRKAVMIVFTFAGVVASLAPLYVGNGLGWLIGLVFVGCLTLGTVPLFMATIPLESVPGGAAASATALVMGVGQISGGFLGPALGGVLADRWGLSVPLWMATGAAILAGLLSLRLTETAPRRSKSS
jgi:MFS family permease